MPPNLNHLTENEKSLWFSHFSIYLIIKLKNGRKRLYLLEFHYEVVKGSLGNVNDLPQIYFHFVDWVKIIEVELIEALCNKSYVRLSSQ